MEWVKKKDNVSNEQDNMTESSYLYYVMNKLLLAGLYKEFSLLIHSALISLLLILAYKPLDGVLRLIGFCESPGLEKESIAMHYSRILEPLAFIPSAVKRMSSQSTSSAEHLVGSSTLESLKSTVTG